jgi:hypothetical protein
MSVRATFAFDPAEHYRALRQVTRRTSAQYISWVFVAIAGWLAYWNAFRFWGEYPTWGLIWTALPYLLLGGFWLGLIPYSQWRAARKAAKSDPSVQGPQTREIDDVGFRSSGNDVVLELPWKAILRGVETNQFFLFYYSKQLAYYVPKRALGAADAEELRRLMRDNLGTRAQVMPP